MKASRRDADDMNESFGKVFLHVVLPSLWLCFRFMIISFRFRKSERSDSYSPRQQNLSHRRL